MVHIRIASNDDKNAWNEVAQKSLNSTYGHTWEWKEVLEQGLNLKSICLIAEEKEEIIGIYPGFLYPKFKEDEIHGVLKFMVGKAQVLWSPLQITYDYGGPCVLSGTNKEVIEELLSYMEKLARKSKAIDIRVSPFNGNDLKQILTQRSYRTSQRLTSIIDLTKSEEELWQLVKKDAKRGVKRARRDDVIVKYQDVSITDIYKCLAEVHEHNEAYLPEDHFFKTISEIMVPKKMVRFYTAQIGNEIIAGSIYFYFKDMCVERYRSSLYSHRKMYPDNLLLWTAIIDAKNLGCKIFDFGGMPSDQSSGIYFFKSRWGGEIKNIDWYVKNVKFEKLRTLRQKTK